MRRCLAIGTHNDRVGRAAEIQVCRVFVVNGTVFALRPMVYRISILAPHNQHGSYRNVAES